MSKPFHNLPVEDLTEDNDYLGIIEKGEIIKSFLESNTDEFSQIKMFSLYGEWGSGKSTLMKYLQKELKGSFNTFFFEAWEFEKDDNLSISLLNYLLEKSNTVGDEVAKDILKYGGKILRGLGKSVQFNVPLYPKGPSIGVNPSKFVDEFAKAEDVTFYKALVKFKEDFVRWEDLRNKRKDKEYNIIFIDDLDRCEPEKVLNLLSALKLFFTYGKKTIFMCGIDKKAVNEAVKTKYQEVVKANEYLEKIFDLSFTMPNYSDVSKLVSQHFGNEIVKFEDEDVKWANFISNFLKEIGETNPRRVKKVLNKYLVLNSLGGGCKSQIPNIYNKGSESSVFETVLVIYIIILHEFYYEKYTTLFDLKYKE
jgi:DNA polymerase III delta prime subunit